MCVMVGVSMVRDLVVCTSAPLEKVRRSVMFVSVANHVHTYVYPHTGEQVFGNKSSVGWVGGSELCDDECSSHVLFSVEECKRDTESVCSVSGYD